eukprot:12682022-Alexandrium_andersonii.AAC.1
MSASLVGSEMCIRDRCPRGRRVTDHAAKEIDRVAHLASRAPLRHHDPVSYTHLTLPTICSV